MAKQAYKRRNYLIDKGAQLKFMAAFGLASLLSAAVAVFIFASLAQNKLEKSLYSMRLPETTLAGLLFNEMVLTTGIAVIVVILLFSYTLKKTFVRIEGPLNKLRGVIRRIKEGNLRDNVALREKDEFQTFAHALDEMKEKLRTTIQTIQFNSEKLSRIEAGDAQNLDLLTEECQGRLKIMKQELEQLRL